MADKLSAIRNILSYHLFPHMGRGDESLYGKAFFLGLMCHEIFLVKTKRKDADNRDNFTNKNIQTAGPLMLYVLVDLFKKLNKSVRKKLQEDIYNGNPPQDPSTIIKGKLQITQRYRYSLSTGNWTVGPASYNLGMHGITAQLIRPNLVASISHLQRLNTPIPKEGKVKKPRELGPTQMGRLCPPETPDRDSVGLTKNFALCPHISVGYHGALLDKYFDLFDLKPLNLCRPEELMNRHILLVNGCWKGTLKKEAAHKLVDLLRKLKRSMDLSYETSIILEDEPRKMVIINTDGGRFMRALLVVDTVKGVHYIVAPCRA